MQINSLTYLLLKMEQLKNFDKFNEQAELWAAVCLMIIVFLPPLANQIKKLWDKFG